MVIQKLPQYYHKLCVPFRSLRYETLTEKAWEGYRDDRVYLKQSNWMSSKFSSWTKPVCGCRWQAANIFCVLVVLLHDEGMIELLISKL